MARKPIRFDSEWESYVYSTAPDPIRCLLTALLGRALIDLTSRNKQTVREAVGWFLATKAKRELGFSYLQVMEVLEFKPSQRLKINNYIREIINGKPMQEGKAGREKYCELVEGEGVFLSPAQCSALRIPHRNFYRVDR